ncbi:hypothetical protein PCE1_000173 [Barthelona sp. PCE]
MSDSESDHSSDFEGKQFHRTLNDTNTKFTLRKLEQRIEKQEKEGGRTLEDTPEKIIRTRKPKNSASKFSDSGIIYIDRLAPHLHPASVRHLFEHHGTVKNLYLRSKKSLKGSRKKTSGKFVDGWVEIDGKAECERIYHLLNNKQIKRGNRIKSKADTSVWHLKILKNVSWKDLQETIAHEYRQKVERKRLALNEAVDEHSHLLKLFTSHKRRGLIKENNEEGSEKGSEGEETTEFQVEQLPFKIQKTSNEPLPQSFINKLF